MEGGEGSTGRFRLAHLYCYCLCTAVGAIVVSFETTRSSSNTKVVFCAVPPTALWVQPSQLLLLLKVLFFLLMMAFWRSAERVERKTRGNRCYE